MMSHYVRITKLDAVGLKELNEQLRELWQLLEKVGQALGLRW